MIRSLIALVFLAAAVSSGNAGTVEIKPGKYVRDGDTGWLTIQKDKQNRLRFVIQSVGGNCHQCDVSGLIREGVGYTDDPECVISFSTQKSAIAVEPSTDEQCRLFCGARAGFDGTYTASPAACTDASRQAQRDRFLALYRSRQYSQAAGMLETLLAQCNGFINWIEKDQIRSDLALSHYHNHDAAQCLETLNATLAAKVNSEEELKLGTKEVFLPSCDFDNYIKVARTIWFNKTLCTQAKQGESKWQTLQ